MTLAAAGIATFLLSLGDTAPAVAMPTIGRSLNLGVSGLEWVVNAYAVALAVFLLAGGVLGDRFGHRRIFLVGVGISIVASLWAGAAQDGAELIAARSLQGLGGALVTPAALALVSSVTSERRRGLAIGLWAGASAAGLAAGPLVGALLAEWAGWRWVFLINAPLGALALVAGRMLVADPPRDTPPGPVDATGMVLVGGGLFGLVFGLTEGMAYGWRSPLIIGALVAAAGAAGVLVVRRRTRSGSAPLVTPANRRGFLGVNAVTLLATSVMCSILFFASIFLQLAAGYSAIRTGLLFLPMTILIFVLSPVAGYVSDKVGRRRTVVGGMIGLAGALALLSRVVLNGGPLGIALGLATVGLAVPFVTTPSTAGGLDLVEPDARGRAAGVLNTSRAIGLALGIALMGAIVNTSWPRGLIMPGPARELFASNLSTAFLVNAGLAAATAVLAAITLAARPLQARKPGR